MIFRQSKIRHFTFQFIFFILSVLLSANELEFEISADTAYLPYKSFEARDVYKQEDCSYPEHNPLEVVKPAIKNQSDGLLMLSNNFPPSSNHSSMFTPRTFPGWHVPDDDPLAYIITNWKSYVLGSDSLVFVVGVCHNDDAIFAFKLFVDTDSIEYKLLYVRQPSDDGPVIPNASILYLGDFGSDGAKELLLFVEFRRHFRKLYLLDFETLELRWERSVASGVNPTTLNVYDSDEDARIIFATGNSGNGMKDSEYNDAFSYVTILNRDGEILYKQLASHYGLRAPALIKADVENEFFVTHTLDIEADDSVSFNTANEYYLSRLDASGEVLKTTIIKGIPISIWLMYYGDADQMRLFVLLSSKAIAMYDCDLNLIEVTDVLEKYILYNGRYKIAGERDSVYVFTDGLYDKELNKLLQFPFYSGDFTPVEYDSAGNVTAYLITEHLHFYIGYIQKRTNLELASVFYHRNRNYVLIFLTSLLVALVTTNIFRRRSKSNLELISIQKTELEGLHEDLKKAQSKLVAQGKYEQAKDIAGGFAHEIRNALSPARNALSKLNVMNDLAADTDKTKKLTDLSNRGVIRALELTQQISNYTKLESLKSPEEVNLTEVVNEVLGLHERMIEDNQIVVSITSNNTALVIANADQLRIVVTNLIHNAIDAMQESPNKQLHIESVESATSISLVISDSGQGIPPENIDRVFDFFYSTKPDTGTGIGLAISKKIVELYDGTINVECPPDGLTTFIIKFPRITQ